MSASFTPGPWWFSPHGAHGLEIAGITFPFGYIEAPDRMPMFELGTISKARRGKEMGELVASAHLIAAAPDLYAALKELWASAKFEPENPVHNRVAVALAKARGEVV